MPSFDVVSKPDMHEIRNAFDQAVKEIKTRFDFKDTQSELEMTDNGFKFRSNSEEKVKSIYAVLEDKFLKRKVSLKFLEHKDPQPAGNLMWTMEANLKKSLDQDNAKKLVGIIKEQKWKVTASIMGDKVRVTGKQRDDLQTVIKALREKEFPVPLAFENFLD